MAKIRIVSQFMAPLLPILDLPDTSAGIFIQRDTIAVNQFRILFLDKVRSIFRRMLTGLCNVIAESAHQLQPDHIIVLTC